MHLNTIKSAPGARKPHTRLGRGMGSGIGKTGGRGHKGQKARSGGFRKVGFEGGQMPLQRRLPKSGFTSRISKVTDEVRLSELNKVIESPITLDALKRANIVSPNILQVKIIRSGELVNPVVIQGIKVTKGALEAIQKLGGKVELDV